MRHFASVLPHERECGLELASITGGLGVRRLSLIIEGFEDLDSFATQSQVDLAGLRLCILSRSFQLLFRTNTNVADCTALQWLLHCAIFFRGRPPNLPFFRTAAAFAGLVTLPPLVPILESQSVTDFGSVVMMQFSKAG